MFKANLSYFGNLFSRKVTQTIQGPKFNPQQGREQKTNESELEATDERHLQHTDLVTRFLGSRAK